MEQKRNYPLDPVLLSRARQMRHDPAPAEKKLWALLRDRQLGGWKFRRQTPLGSFVADFFCHELNLIVELDGDSHGDAHAEKRDHVRTRILQRDGHHVIRFWNTDVFNFTDEVLEAIYAECERLAGQTPPHPVPLPEGEGECIDPLSPRGRVGVRGASNDVDTAVAVLRRGGLVAIPTETVYGLGADATNLEAVLRIFQAKRRPATNPLICHVADANVAQRYAITWPPTAAKLAARFWPGPLTLVLPKHPSIVAEATAGLDTVGLRVPDHPLTLELLRAFDGAVAAPSANKSTRVSPTTARHVRDELGDAVDLILDGGPCTVGIESTVLDLSGDVPRILRPGGVTREQVEAEIGKVMDLSDLITEATTPAASPGQHLVHYAPHTPAYRFEPHQLPQIDPTEAAILPINLNPETYARQFYARLRMLDEQGLRAIYIEMPPNVPQWAAVRDRILRATQPLEEEKGR